MFTKYNMVGILLLVSYLTSGPVSAVERLAIFGEMEGCYHRDGYTFCARDGRYDNKHPYFKNATDFQADDKIHCVLDAGIPHCWGRDIFKQPQLSKYDRYLGNWYKNKYVGKLYCVELALKEQISCYSVVGQHLLQLNEVSKVRKLVFEDEFAWVLDSNGLHAYAISHTSSLDPVGNPIPVPPQDNISDFILIKGSVGKRSDVCMAQKSAVSCWEHKRYKYELILYQDVVPLGEKHILKMSGPSNDISSCVLYNDGSLTCREQSAGNIDHQLFTEGIKDFMLEGDAKLGAVIRSDGTFSSFRISSNDPPIEIKKPPAGSWDDWTNPRFTPRDNDRNKNTDVCIAWNEGSKCFDIWNLHPIDDPCPLEPNIQGTIRFTSYHRPKYYHTDCQFTEALDLKCHGDLYYTIDYSSFSNVHTMHILKDFLIFIDGDEIKTINRNKIDGIPAGILNSAMNLPGASLISAQHEYKEFLVYAQDQLYKLKYQSSSGWSVVKRYPLPDTPLKNPFRMVGGTFLDEEGWKSQEKFFPFKNVKWIPNLTAGYVSDDLGIHMAKDGAFHLIAPSPTYRAIFDVYNRDWELYAIKEGKVSKFRCEANCRLFPKYETGISSILDIVPMLRLAAYEAPIPNQAFLIGVTNIGNSTDDVGLISLSLLPYLRNTFGTWKKELGAVESKIGELLLKHEINSLADISYDFDRALRAVGATTSIADGLDGIITPQQKHLWEELRSRLRSLLTCASPRELSDQIEDLHPTIIEFKAVMQTHFLLRSRIKTVELLLQYARNND